MDPLFCADPAASPLAGTPPLVVTPVAAPAGADAPADPATDPLLACMPSVRLLVVGPPELSGTGLMPLKPVLPPAGESGAIGVARVTSCEPGAGLFPPPIALGVEVCPASPQPDNKSPAAATPIAAFTYLIGSIGLSRRASGATAAVSGYKSVLHRNRISLRVGQMALQGRQRFQVQDRWQP